MQLLKTKYINLLALPMLVVLCVIALPTQKVFAASTYTVNSTGDGSDATPGDSSCETTTPGECTLRAAIEEVNAGSGGDTINFGIAGSGVHTLTPGSPYDTITKSVTINGYSQPGSSPNTAVAPAGLNGTLTIELDGFIAGGNGLGAASGAGTITVTVKGLIIHSFNLKGIAIADNVNAIISGNYIGTDATGTNELTNNQGGVTIVGDNTFTVGGLNPGDRNLISGNSADAGVNIESSGEGTKVIQGNLIGTDVSGMSALHNSLGVRLVTTGNATIGGTATGSKNVISGNDNAGILLNGNSSDNIIQGNYFGLDSAGTGSLPNPGLAAIAINTANGTMIGGNTAAARNIISNGPDAFWGAILVTQALDTTIQGNYIGTDKDGNVVSGLGNSRGMTFANNTYNSLVGGTSLGEPNRIAGNGVGVHIAFLSAIGGESPLNASIIGNDIEQNAGSGIRLCNDTGGDFVCDTPEPYPNDAGDPDVGPNMFMNFPVINSATKGSGQVTVNYNLDINPAEAGATGYNVAFYANSTNVREGAIYLGSDTVSGDVTARSKTLTLPGSVPSDYYVTAVTTMTDASADGFGHSSEFSASVEATSGSDTDNISDTIENASPNNGDANNDGTPDSEQDNVASLLDPETQEYAVLEVSDECSITTVSIDSESSAHGDSDFSYPAGLMDFTLDCGTNGFTATVTQYYYGASGNFTVRKYNPSNQTYQTIDTASISNQTIGAKSAKVATYQVKDGGSLDLDNTEDGNIHDPAGLATPSGSLADTGQNTTQIVLLATILLTSGLTVSTYTFNKQRKKYAATKNKTP